MKEQTMQTITTRRKANVSRAAAMAELLERHPDADILSLVQRGSTFVATLRIAGDEPPMEESSESSDEPSKSDDAPSDSDSDSSDDSDSDSDSGAPDLPGGDEGGDDLGMDAPAVPSADESLAQIVHLLTQLVSGGGGGHAGPPMPPHHAPPGGPPMGGPPPGPPMGGGPAGPGGHPGAPPLPPPAQKHNQPGLGSPAFAHFVASRPDAHEVTDNEAAQEVLAAYPGYKIAKLQRDREMNVIKVAMVKQ